MGGKATQARKQKNNNNTQPVLVVVQWPKNKKLYDSSKQVHSLLAVGQK